MKDYLQPDFYRFNQDSIELVRWVSTQIKSARRILDLGAGCGVIGLELARALHPEQLTLVEVQGAFGPYLEENLKIFLPNRPGVRIDLMSFQDWTPDARYDLIVSNPPYYLPGHGEASQCQQRGICRTFHIDGWEILLELISKSLSSDGHAFISVKNDFRILELIRKLVVRLNLRLKEGQVRDLVFCELTSLNIE